MKAAQQFAIDAINAGWDVLIARGTDTGGSPFVSVEAKHDKRHLRLTWHTRATGTYRLFSCALGHRDITLTAARYELAKEPAA